MKWIVEERGPAIQGSCWMQKGTVEAETATQARSHVKSLNLRSSWDDRDPIKTFRVRKFPTSWEGISYLDRTVEDQKAVEEQSHTKI
jgi:hypothetical protein